jgi:hypothetical protein
VEGNRVVQQSGFPTSIATFVLPSTMVGGQTNVYIARNRFSTDSSKKWSAFVATRFHTLYTRVASSAV